MFLAYVKRTERGSIDARMAEIAQRAMAAGLHVAGVVQTNIPRAQTFRCDMDVQVLPDGPVIRISQDLGPHARGCWLDPSALERSVDLVERSLSATTDLLVVNKFGKHEASGRGFRPVIGAALADGIPVIVGLNAANQEAFDSFAGDFAFDLTENPARLDDWINDRATVAKGA